MTTIVQIRLRISNAFLIQGDRPVLVDTGSPKEGERILRALARSGVEPRDLALVVHTHGHSDHCGSTQQLKKVISAPTLVSGPDAVALEAGRNPKTKPTGFTGRLLHLLVSGTFPRLRPDIIVSEETSLQDFGIDGRVVLTPGHTAGSISVLLNSGESIVGDMLMGGWFGGLFRSGHPCYPYYADELGQLRASVEKLLELGTTKFYVGHGGPLMAERVSRWLERTRGDALGGS